MLLNITPSQSPFIRKEVIRKRDHLSLITGLIIIDILTSSPYTNLSRFWVTACVTWSKISRSATKGTSCNRI